MLKPLPAPIKTRWQQFQKLWHHRRAVRYKKFFTIYLSPFVTIGLLCLFRMQFDEFIPHSRYLFFTLIIFFHAWYGGVVSGIIASVVGVLAANYFLTAPLFEINYDSQETVIQAGIFLLQSVVISVVTGRFSKVVSKLRTANARLRYGQEKLRDVIDSIFTLIAIVQPDGTIVEANNTFMALFPQGNVIGSNILQAFPWKYDRTVRSRLQAAINDTGLEQPTRYEDMLKVGDDQFMSVTMNIVAVDDTNDGEVDYLIISAIDITEQKEYEQELEDIRNSYQKLVSSNIIGMVIGDGEGNIYDINDAMLQMVGYDKADFIEQGVNWIDITPPEYREHKRRAMQQIVEDGFAGPFEKEVVHRDGRRIPIMLSGVLIDEDTHKCLCLVVDMTVQKELQQRKDEFVSIASHELKTPLTTIKGYTQLLGNALQKRAEENNRYVDMLNNQLDKLNDLINELLDISRIQSGKLSINKTEFSLTELVKEVVGEAQLFTSQHQIKLSVPRKDVIIEADRFRISQVMMNFLTNAIRYSPNAEQINVQVSMVAEGVRVAVQDFGIGIAEEKIPLVFDKFFQVQAIDNNVIQGLGLGLYISSEIIKQHQGRVGLTSVEGQGSTFHFILPVASR